MYLKSGAQKIQETMSRLSRNVLSGLAWVTAVMLLGGVVCVGCSHGQERSEPAGVQVEDSPSVLPQVSTHKPAPDAEAIEAESTEAESTEAVAANEDLLSLNPDFISAYQSLDASLKYEPAKPIRIRNRIVTAGVFGGALLGFLSVLFGYLKLNHLTRGFYSGRLQTLSIACVILILGLCYFLWTQVLFK